MFARGLRAWVATAGLLALCVLPATAAAPLRAGQTAPPFALKNLDGKPLRLDQYRGKPTYIDFFATWCAPCREETPAIVKFAKQYAKRGLVVLGINDQEGKDKSQDFHDQYKITYPIGLGDKKMIDAYGVIALPVHVFIDHNGVVKLYRLGEMTAAEIEAGIKSIL
jgi:thiol-disulfide isomerase/thioredoxin